MGRRIGFFMTCDIWYGPWCLTPSVTLPAMTGCGVALSKHYYTYFSDTDRESGL